MMRSLSIASLVVVILVGSWTRAAADILIRPEHEAVVVSEDNTDLEFGGLFFDHTVSNGCSSNIYRESTCDDLPGTHVTDDTRPTAGMRAVINGDTLAICTRYRRESVCTSCSTFGGQTNCVQTTTETFGGSYVKYNLIPSPGKVAKIGPLTSSSTTALSFCSDVCTDAASGGLVFPNMDQSSCALADGWYGVNSDYDNACAVKRVCEELEVLEGCADTYIGSFAGIYRPRSNNDDCSSTVDTTRTVYQGDRGIIAYHATENDWRFAPVGDACTLPGPSIAEWDGGDEPFLNPEDTVECYDGGYASEKEYEHTSFSIRCNRQGGSPGGGRNSAASKEILDKIVATLVAAFVFLAW